MVIVKGIWVFIIPMAAVVFLLLNKFSPAYAAYISLVILLAVSLVQKATRPTLGHYLADRAELLSRAGDLFEWMAAGGLQVRIDKIFPLSEAAEAHRYLEARKTQGKLLLIP